MFDQKAILAGLQKTFPNMSFDTEAYLSDYTYMKVGGKAALMTFPANLDEMVSLLNYCVEQGVKYFIIGRGSNLIVNDEGVDALFIHTKYLTKMSVQDELMITVEVGTDLKDVSAFALSNELSGFEFACGIPGSIGGAVYMNAGAYTGEMKDVVVSTKAFIPKKGVVTFSNEDQAFEYRKSVFSNSDMVILETTIKLQKSDPKEIAEMIDDLTQKREDKQPLEMPSAGSTFKRPEGYFAGKLITDAGLKGFQLGGAAISSKHAGFVVNAGGASAQNILDLIEHVRAVVKSQFGVMLEPEVKFLQKDASFKEF
ncbi:MAG: UDP-N-acetylmuramate dehydrogenase [Brevinema sp.]